MSKNAKKIESEEHVAQTSTEAPTRDLSKYDAAALKKEHGTWSGVFRALHGEGLTKGEISKVTGKRYQHVRNVLITPVAKVQA